MTNRPRHSRLCVASLVLAVMTWSAAFLLLAAGFVTESGTHADRRATNAFLVFGLLVAPVVHSAGLVTGVVGAYKSRSRGLLPIAAIGLHGLALAFVAIGWIAAVVIVVAVLRSGGGWH